MKSATYRLIGGALIGSSLFFFAVFALYGSLLHLLEGYGRSVDKAYMGYLLLFIIYPLIAGIYYMIVSKSEALDNRFTAQSSIFFAVMMVMIALKFIAEVGVNSRINVFVRYPLDFVPEFILSSIGSLLFFTGLVKRVNNTLATITLGILLFLIGWGIFHFVF